MDFDFAIDNESVIIVEREGNREKRRAKRKSIQVINENLRKLAIDMVNSKMGES